ncbi:metallophosphoesterase family protein [Pseudooceanicola aestuarii]|uniref:metallophosphoesterase family protein n=1 Tax=Pseudooceanicola aestuarii TaxID=2697319 RepID=UPI0013D7F8C4|nr:metallophosphoesterase family protein [Pseudooceanicola aestuarii]
MRIYAIGDIHGQRALLEEQIARIDADGGAEARLVFLGDLVDRGPDSQGVIQLILDGMAAGRRWRCVRGNHDQMFLDFRRDGTVVNPNVASGLPWPHRRLGGLETLRSYGVDVDPARPNAALQADLARAMPAAHRDFLTGLPLWIEEAGFLFVHAGLRPGVPLADQNPQDMMWIRDAFHRYSDPWPWLVVHGHTPVEMATHYGNRVNLDTGAGHGKALTTAVFEGGEAYALTASGRRRLVPNPA